MRNMVQYTEMKKVTIPKWDNQRLSYRSSYDNKCDTNSQYNADNSGNIGNQATRRDLCALYHENMPCSVHQYVQSDGNPYIEIPFNVHPTEIKCTDKGYTESSERRKNIVTLIEMHRTKIKSW